MDRNQASISKRQSGRAAWQRTMKGVVCWVAAFTLALLAWVDLQSTLLPGISRSLSILGLFLLHAVLVLAIERGLAHTPLERKADFVQWRYRLAFLISAGLPLVYGMTQWLISMIFPPHALHGALSISAVLLPLAVACLAAFMGSVLATGMNEGLCENNSPPPEHIRTEVYQRHLQRIGVPGAGLWSKRGFDLCLAFFGLILTAPIWVVSAFVVWFEDPGPILFVKNSVGRGGKNFRQYKFRTMMVGAEDNTGPILATRSDQRVLILGRFLRKTALDELPQLVNILRGEMSFVGPRPQRTVLVYDYLQAMPEYAERHRVLPGLAGLAQVVGDYYLTPRQKLRLDRLYIRYLSLGFDLKLLLLACLITFWYRWQKDWNGRLPRRLLHYL
jgi:lipopolysaccharide/colanic/teichoic acid biosynthesis glycosyltransferase